MTWKENTPTFEPGEIIVSMIEFQGRLLLASSFHVYELIGMEWVEMALVNKETGMLK